MEETTHSRPWTVIASEVSREKDSAKLIKLVEELNRAMAAQGIGSSKEVSQEHHPNAFSKTA